MTAKLLALSAFALCIGVVWFFYRLNKSGAHPHGAPKPKQTDRKHLIFVDREGVSYLPTRKVEMKAKV